MNMVFILLIILGFLLQFSKILQNKFWRAEKCLFASYRFIRFISVSLYHREPGIYQQITINMNNMNNYEVRVLKGFFCFCKKMKAWV